MKKNLKHNHSLSKIWQIWKNEPPNLQSHSSAIFGCISFLPFSVHLWGGCFTRSIWSTPLAISDNVFKTAQTSLRAPLGLGPNLFCPPRITLHLAPSKYTSVEWMGLSYEKENSCSSHLGTSLALTARPWYSPVGHKTISQNTTVVQGHSETMMEQGINKTAL